MGEAVPTVDRGHLRGFCEQIIKPIFPDKLPPHLRVVDVTSPDRGKHSSVDRLQVILKGVAGYIFGQTKLPKTTLLRLADKAQKETWEHTPLLVESIIIWTKLPQSNEEPPRGSAEFDVGTWKIPKDKSARLPIKLALEEMASNLLFKMAITQMVRVHAFSIWPR